MQATPVPESARQPELEERCRKSGLPAMVVTRNGGPTEFTRWKRVREGNDSSAGRSSDRAAGRGETVWATRSQRAGHAREANRVTGVAERAAGSVGSG